MNENIKFPLAIKVNAWLILSYPLLLLIALSMALFSNNSEYAELVKYQIFDKNEPMLSWMIILENVIVFVLVWMMYINKKYYQYIVNIFYLDYFFNVLINISAFKEEPMITGILMAIEGLPILWLYLSEDVKNFLNTVKRRG